MEDDGVELVVGHDYIALKKNSARWKLESINMDYDKSNWPVGRNLFIDFTTAVPESNDIPVWTNMKPNNNSIIPLMTGTEYLLYQ